MLYKVLYKKSTYYGLPRCWGPGTSSKMAAILDPILDFTENQKLSKNDQIKNFDAGHVEYDIIKHFAAFC